MLVYEAGPLGIAVGGTLLLQVPPFWGWSTPQRRGRGRARATRASSTATPRASSLAPETLGPRPARDPSRAAARSPPASASASCTAPGPRGAAVDRYAERESRFCLAVDGDGDGVRAWIAEPPARRRRGRSARAPRASRCRRPRGPASRCRCARPCSTRAGNAGVAFEGTLRLALPPGVEGSAELALPAAAHAGSRERELRTPSDGIVRVRAEGPGGLAAREQPAASSSPDAPRLLFGDLHGHSNLSDGTGTPEDYFRYARDVAALDVAALTDHDHWGIPFLDETPSSGADRGSTRRASTSPAAS